MSNEFTTESGVKINPMGNFKELLVGTSYEHNKGVQDNLQQLSNAFVYIGESEEGKDMMTRLEELCSKVKSEGGLFHAFKVAWRLAKFICEDPWIQFGLFLGIIGIIIALLAHFGFNWLGLPGLGSKVRDFAVSIIVKALVPLQKGVNNAVENYMKSSEESVVGEKETFWTVAMKFFGMS